MDQDFFMEKIHLTEIPTALEEFICSFLMGRKKEPAQAEILPIPGDGSTRTFFRIRLLENAISYIAMANPPTTEYAYKENTAYLYIGSHLKRKGIAVPHIYAWDLARGLFILEDFGDHSLQDATKASGDPYQLYQGVIEILLKIQLRGRDGFDVNWTCQSTHYDKTVMRKYEADYFVRAFLEGYLDYHAPKRELGKSFHHIAQMASTAAPVYLMHRDFQSRNIMVMDSEFGILDWQGARLGPLGYDLASLLIDPYVDLEEGIKTRLLDDYLSELRDMDNKLAEEVARTYPYLAIQRNLQILGAFSYLTKVENKTYFESYIPIALDSLRALLEEVGHTSLGPLRSVLGEITLDITPSHV
ncbi:MAG TPA: hypothetical protein EYP06_02600 [Desulfobacterales bacterium]|nr:hypothetical protein [Desulfobacterales bacterium]